MKEGNLAFGVYEEIKKRILRLELPPEAVFQERALADELKVSRTPIREAVHRLSQEGWVVVNSRRNIQVRSVSERDLHDVFQARFFLERDVLDLVLSNKLHREAAQAMVATLSEMERDERGIPHFITTDQEFHTIPFRVVGSVRLQRFWNTVSEEVVWLGMLVMDEERHPQVLEEHRAMVTALEEGRKKTAREALARHLERTKENLVRKLHHFSRSNENESGRS